MNDLPYITTHNLVACDLVIPQILTMVTSSSPILPRPIVIVCSMSCRATASGRFYQIPATHHFQIQLVRFDIQRAIVAPNVEYLALAAHAACQSGFANNA